METRDLAIEARRNAAKCERHDRYSCSPCATVATQLGEIAEVMQDEGYPAEAQDHVNAACDVLRDHTPPSKTFLPGQGHTPRNHGSWQGSGRFDARPTS